MKALHIFLKFFSEMLKARLSKIAADINFVSFIELSEAEKRAILPRTLETNNTFYD